MDPPPGFPCSPPAAPHGSLSFSLVPPLGSPSSPWTPLPGLPATTKDPEGTFGANHEKTCHGENLLLLHVHFGVSFSPAIWFPAHLRDTVPSTWNGQASREQRPDVFSLQSDPCRRPLIQPWMNTKQQDHLFCGRSCTRKSSATVRKRSNCPLPKKRALVLTFTDPERNQVHCTPTRYVLFY